MLLRCGAVSIVQLVVSCGAASTARGKFAAIDMNNCAHRLDLPNTRSRLHERCHFLRE